jgi:hypothetical protein
MKRSAREERGATVAYLESMRAGIVPTHPSGWHMTRLIDRIIFDIGRGNHVTDGATPAPSADSEKKT